MITNSFQAKKSESVKYQYLATAVVNIIEVSYGIVAGWPSPTIHLLTSDQSPFLIGKITLEEASWIGSLMDVGSIFGCILFGFITITFSRKRILNILAIPAIVSWCIILVAQNTYYLYVARILQGVIFTGIKLEANFFLIEISTDRIRGFVISTVNLVFIAGTANAFTLGAFCDFYTMSKVSIALIILFLILIYFFPETPVFLIKRNQISDAQKSLRFYRNLSERDDELLRLEMEKLTAAIGDVETNESKEKIRCVDFVEAPGRKAMIITFFVATLSQCCDTAILMTFTANIFRESGSMLTPNMSSIVVGLIQLSGACIATSLVKQIRRKILLVVSAIGVATGEIVLGTYTMLKSWGYDVVAYNWIPLASFSFIILMASSGILALIMVTPTELMPLKIRQIGISFSMITLLLFQFIVIKNYPILIESIGFHGSMFMFATICLLSTIFIIIYIPETKDKTYEEIMNMLK